MEENKTEYQKMLDGELYNAEDPELLRMRADARKILRKHNAAIEEEQPIHLRELIGTITDKIKLEPPFYCDYGKNIHVGKSFYMNFDCVILDCAKVTIGDYVLCGPKVQILTATHPVDPELRLQGKEFAKPITIGNNVWIGGGAIICPGVTIGDNAVIGAGSVVTKDIPANVVAVGNPCKVIKHITKEN